MNDKRGRWEDVGQLKQEAEEACEQESPCMVGTPNIESCKCTGCFLTGPPLKITSFFFGK